MNLHLMPTPSSQTREERDIAFRRDFELHAHATRWDRRSKSLAKAALVAILGTALVLVAGGAL
jgi:hypothetical protein